MVAHFLTGSLKLLAEAEKLCRKSLQEEEPGISPDDLEKELALVRVQTGLARQALSQDKEAMLIYKGVLKSRPDDAGVAAVAANNIVVLNKDVDLFDSKKKIKVTTMEGGGLKLTALQRRVF